MQYDGVQYGIPTDLSLHFLYYRNDLIDALISDKSQYEKYADISEKYMGIRLEPKNPND